MADAADGSVSVAENSDGIETNVTLPTGVEEGDTITLTITNPDGSTTEQAYTVTAADITNGSADITIPSLTDEGAYSVTSSISDTAGNTTAESTPVNFTLDTTPPTTTVSIDGATDDVGPYTGILSDGDVTDDTILTLNGTLSADLVAGETINIYDGGILLGTATTVSGTSWTYDDSRVLPHGATPAYTAVVIDGVGNTGAISDEFNLTVNTSTPLIDLVQVGDFDIAYNESNNVTLSGTTTNVEDGQIVTLTVTDSVGTSATFTAVVSGNTWSVNADLTDKGFVDGSITVQAEVSNAAGVPATVDTETATLELPDAPIDLEFSIAGPSPTVVNELTDGDQSQATTTSLVGGGYVSIWRDSDNNPDNGGLYGQIFNDDGTRVGGTFEVTISDWSHLPLLRNYEVISLSSGGFALAVSGLNETAGAYDSAVAVFDASGNQVDSFVIADPGFYPKIVETVDGNIATVYQQANNTSIFLRVDEPDGTDVVAPVVISTGTAFSINTQLLALDNGNLVVAYRDGDTGPFEMYVYDSAGVLLTTTTFGGNGSADSSAVWLQDVELVSNDDGGISAVYEQEGNIYFQSWDASGGEVIAPIQISDVSGRYFGDPEIIQLSNGDYYAVWVGVSDADSTDRVVYGQRLDETGALIGSVDIINTDMPSDVHSSRDINITELSTGEVTVSWTATLADGSGSGVFQRTIGTAAQVIENPEVGDIIGGVSTVTDPDVGDTFTYSLSDDANGAVTIDPSTGVVTIADPSKIDYETSTTLSFTIRVTDSMGLTYDEVVTLDVLDEGPSIELANVNDIAYNESDSVTISGTTARVEDNQTVTVTITDSAGTTATYTTTVTNDTWTLDADLTGQGFVAGNITVTASVIDAVGEPASSNAETATLDVPDAPTDLVFGEAGSASTSANSSTAGNQNAAQTTSLSDGKYAIAWLDSGSGSWSTKGRIYNEDGTAATDEFLITFEGNNKGAPQDIITLANGSFAVSAQIAHNGTYYTGIAIIDENGNQTSDFYTNSFAYYVNIDETPDGNIASVYTTTSTSPNSLVLEVHDQSGNQVVNPVTIDSDFTWNQYAQVTVLSNGDIIVGYRDGNTADHVIKVYSSTGVLTNTIDFGGPGINGNNLTMTENSNGGITVTYENNGEIYLQAWDQTYTEIIAPVQLSSLGESSNYYPEIVELSSGGYYVVWQHDNPDGTSDLWGQAISSTGTLIGESTHIGSNVIGDSTINRRPSISELSSGEIIVSWVGDSADGSGTGIVQQIVGTGLQIVENPNAGDIVGGVRSVTDPDVGDTFTYSLVDDANGAFTIDSITGIVTVADPSKIDYEQSETLDMTIRVTDSMGLTYDEVVTIKIIDGEETVPDPTPNDDVISATSDDDIIDGLAGNDVFYAGAGDDVIVGNTGDDTIYGGSGNDVIDGGGGTPAPTYSKITPVTTGTTGEVTATSEDGNFTVTVSDNDGSGVVTANNVTKQTHLTDYFSANVASSNDKQTFDFGQQVAGVKLNVSGMSSYDTMWFRVDGEYISLADAINTGRAAITGDYEFFRAWGSSNIDALNPVLWEQEDSQGNSTGFIEVELFIPLTTLEVLTGGNSGSLQYELFVNTDDVVIPDGQDTLYGGEGNDVILGGEDDDILYGDEGSDVLIGEAGSDTLYGGEGDDVLIGGTVSGNVVASDETSGTVGGVVEPNYVQLLPVDGTFDGSRENLASADGSISGEIYTVYGLRAGSLDDSLRTRGYTDTYELSLTSAVAGAKIVVDEMNLSSEYLYFRIDGVDVSIQDMLDQGLVTITGNYVLEEPEGGGAGVDRAITFDGTGTIEINKSFTDIDIVARSGGTTQKFSYQIFVDSTDPDTITYVNDTYSGSELGDIDILAGGAGNDILTGGDGDDLFVFDSQFNDGDTDTITDFTIESDKIDLTDVLQDDAEPLTVDDFLAALSVAEVDGNMELQFVQDGKTQTIVLEDFAQSDLGLSGADSTAIITELYNRNIFTTD
ncbi:type I secretion C-terminal target domain-containing protein [Vibrio sp. Y20_XG_PY13]|uniref:type I secretion C-terminal target domain-containing protein n=1 Tax=Vibrio sp. Y20_XG_PY13 TaxID=2957761 RepID=UPI00346355E8